MSEMMKRPDRIQPYWNLAAGVSVFGLLSVQKAIASRGHI